MISDIESCKNCRYFNGGACERFIEACRKLGSIDKISMLQISISLASVMICNEYKEDWKKVIMNGQKAKDRR